jgi:outer membrane biosynthesis protein TonB
MTMEFAVHHPLERSRRAHVRALVLRSGQVVYTELARTSGSTEVDLFAQQLFGRMQFLPAILNGAPVDIWVVQPVVLEAR